MTEALLQLPIEKENYYYYNMIQDAVFSENKNEASPCYITSMTKAYFKDGNVDHALEFFDSSIKDLRDLNQQREDFMISLFDSVY